MYRGLKLWIEPVFGHTKHNRKIYPLQLLRQITSPSRMAAGDAHPHLQKLRRHQIAPATC
jgi:hypothetical protein